MRIGINAALLNQEKGYRQTGISRYIGELVRGLEASLDTGESLRLLARKPAALTGHPAARIAWEQAALPIVIGANRLDVFHGPMHVLPMLSRTPGVVTVHDLAYLRFPEQLPTSRRAYLVAMTRLSAHKAERVITVSGNTANDLMQWLNLPEDRVTSIPLAPSDNVQPVTGTSLDVFRMKWDIDRPYVLAVGTLEPRKNLPTLLRAFAKIKDDIDHQLVLVGPEGWLTGELRQTLDDLHLGDRVRLTGFVSDEELGGWYSGADLLAFPSHYEGFGLPAVEAMRCGTAVLSSNSSCFPEVVGDAGVMISPNDVDLWAETMRELLRDESRRDALSRKGRERATRFSWEHTAAETLRVYREVAR